MFAMYAVVFPSKESLLGIPLTQESMIGTVNFLKASEGYFESYPQATYQISIAMRDQWPPSKIQM